MTWSCLDKHPPDCLPPQTERVPPTRRRLFAHCCGRQGRKSQFHCDEKALTVAEVFCLTAGSVFAPTPTSVAAISGERASHSHSEHPLQATPKNSCTSPSPAKRLQHYDSADSPTAPTASSTATLPRCSGSDPPKYTGNAPTSPRHSTQTSSHELPVAGHANSPRRNDPQRRRKKRERAACIFLKFT